MWAARGSSRARTDHCQPAVIADPELGLNPPRPAKAGAGSARWQYRNRVGAEDSPMVRMAPPPRGSTGGNDAWEARAGRGRSARGTDKERHGRTWAVPSRGSIGWGARGYHRPVDPAWRSTRRNGLPTSANPPPGPLHEVTHCRSGDLRIQPVELQECGYDITQLIRYTDRLASPKGHGSTASNISSLRPVDSANAIRDHTVTRSTLSDGIRQNSHLCGYDFVNGGQLRRSCCIDPVISLSKTVPPRTGGVRSTGG